ncbi:MULTISPECIES: VOC family protein [unclassified Nocardioides]|uniref:VOC family protein n=1 Tax=unclassified Nocardioides TaxID=2615069 RepID=UPI000703145A|nr:MULTISPECIES: VOC family protein [unclassified Nocardioides]KRC54930.1 glyoxalase [Nocardioides sp. Root79]KRC73726.1 glyoxalase [Nocardioides sp. Root240]
MDQRISFITLAVADLDATRRFYVDGLGWSPELDVPGEVLMFRAGPALVLSLWERTHFEAEVGPAMTGPGVAPLTIAHNLPTPEGVDDVLATARAAGAPHVQDGVERDWGGYSGYFADPDGYRWEVAFNPDPGLTAIVLPEG